VHKIEIPPNMLERILARRGRAHIYDDIDPARCAHVVVDLQNGFMAPGQPAEIPTAREIVPNVNRVSAALRQAGGLNIFIQNTIDDTTRAGWSVYFSAFSGPERRQRMEAAFAAGSFGHQLWPGLDVTERDVKLRKHRFSALVPGSSELRSVLAGRNIDTLIITGTATNVCCESTARDAMMMDYKVIFVSDGTATHSDAEHNASLGNMLMFTDVMSTDEVVACLARAGRSNSAAE
jgi:ureidoacrylate peracid hydrolase